MDKIYKIYSEDGWKAQVEVIADNSDAEWHRFKLRVVKTIEKSRIVKSAKRGEVFECEKRRGIYIPGIWYLEDIKYCVVAEARISEKRVELTGGMSHADAIKRKVEMNNNSHFRREYRYFNVAKYPY